MAEKKTILVLGATGRQGGATARHLLKRGWNVRILVRDPNKSAAQALKQAGAEIVTGDFDDVASLEAATRGVYGVFSVQASEDEVAQGKRIADVAKQANVQHFIFASVQSADGLARVGGDSNKWEIEQYVWSLGLPATILRPCLFMDDLLGDRYGVSNGSLTIAFDADVSVGLIAAEDIGAFAAIAFDNPQAYLGKTIEIASDILTPKQIAAALSRALGREIPYVQALLDSFGPQSEAIARAFDLLNGTGYHEDLAALREIHPALLTFDAWLAKYAKVTA